jgi:hypothetical protein
MKLLYLFFSLLQVSSEKIIKNINISSCRNCIHYKPFQYSSDFTSRSSKCEKFGEKDIITNEITYDYADSCRKDSSKCGHEGKYFEKEKNINLKILKHSIVSNYLTYLLTSFIIIYSVTLYSLNNR